MIIKMLVKGNNIGKNKLTWLIEVAKVMTYNILWHI